MTYKTHLETVLPGRPTKCCFSLVQFINYHYDFRNSVCFIIIHYHKLSHPVVWALVRFENAKRPDSPGFVLFPHRIEREGTTSISLCGRGVWASCLHFLLLKGCALGVELALHMIMPSWRFKHATEINGKQLGEESFQVFPL
jgi:hypothetical protein